MTSTAHALEWSEAEALAVAHSLADIASAETLSRFRTEMAVENKDQHAFDPVTDADRAAEQVMREYLERERPDDGIHGEEFGHKSSKSGYTWYLDPIDGTRAFVAGLPSWTTLIGIVHGDQPWVGVIDQPFLGERYVGGPSGSIMARNGESQSISTRNVERLTDVVLSTTDYFIMTPAERGAFEHLRATAKLTRYGLDAYAYARLAAGTIDMVAETGLLPHDVAALVPVVRGAGGVATDWRGRPASLGPQLVCAANQSVLDEALISLKRSAN